MNGYFARIAKQSGVRFSKRGESRGGSSGSRGEHMMPLDRDETVMISPAETRITSADERTAARTTEPKQNVHDVAPAAERRRRRSTVPTKSVDETSPRGNESPLAEPVIEDVRLVEPDRPGSSAARNESSVIAFSENKGVAIPPEPGSKTKKPSKEEKRQTDTANSETPDKEFFERTSEIIQGREAEPSTVQTILIQEVQEWIAAGRISTDEMVTDADADRERPLPDETSNVERKPGVIRIGDRKPPDISSDHVQELSSSTAEQLNEQNFEISIGSISVVIEGEEPVSQPPPAATPTSAPSSASPRTSRLSRHYL